MKATLAEKISVRLDGKFRGIHSYQLIVVNPFQILAIKMTDQSRF
jgi:hypothetical protein